MTTHKIMRQKTRDKLKVLHVTPSMSPAWGGPALAVAELAAASAGQGIQCEILTTHGYRVGSGQVPTPGIPIYSFDAGFGVAARTWTGYSRKLVRFLRDRVTDFDLVHIHEIWHFPAYAACCAARAHRLPYVFTIHGELSDWGLRQKALKKRIYRFFVLDRMLREAGALHAITRTEQEQIRKLGFDTPVVVAPNGTKEFSLPSPKKLTQRFPQLNGKRVVLFLGRLHPKKGLDILARSFAAIAGRFDDLALLVVGPDKFGTRQDMEAILNAAGLLERTVFTGLLTGEEKLAALSCADLFVLPSHSDVLGIAVLEALAARVPVVITTGCEFPEVSEYGAGLIAEADATSIAQAMSQLLANKELRRSMGEQGHKLVTERYTWQAAAATMSALYRTLVA